MSRHSRLSVLTRIVEESLLPIFNHPEFETAAAIADACAAGGSGVMEFTNRGEDALSTYARLIKHVRASHPGVMFGAGTIMDEATAASFINMGADFLVSPHFDEGISRLCNIRRIAYIPGCGTVTEISRAEASGVEICKLFPAEEAGGKGFIKMIKGPMPWTSILVAGGVENTRESISSWLDSGACCLAMNTSLIPKDAVAKGNFKVIEENVRKALGFVREWKEKSGSKNV